MVTNPPRGDGHRLGIRDRTQAYDPKNQRWVERDSETDKFMDQKADRGPFKGYGRKNRRNKSVESEQFFQASRTGRRGRVSFTLFFLRSQKVDEYSQNTSFGPRIQVSSLCSSKFKNKGRYTSVSLPIAETAKVKDVPKNGKIPRFNFAFLSSWMDDLGFNNAVLRSKNNRFPWCSCAILNI